MLLYNCELAEDERLKSDSPLGIKYHYWTSLFISVLFPILGTTVVLVLNRSLYSRKGALMGLAIFFVMLGALFVPWYSVGYISGNLPLIVGLVLMQCTFVHFQRAIASVALDNF